MCPELAAVAASQRGPFLRAQALAVGYSSASVGRRVRSGSWVRLRSCVYADASLVTPGTRHLLDVAAALLVVGAKGAVASHTAAAQLLGLELRRAPGAVQLTVPPQSTIRAVSGTLLHRAQLPAHHVTGHTLAATAPGRTVVDLGRRLPLADALVVADAALRRPDLSPEDLQRVLRDCWTWPGIRHAIRVVDFSDPGGESPHETLCRLLFHDLRLPPPRTQVAVGDAHGFIARVDFLWAEHATIAEADGRVKYANAEALWQEKLREDRLREAGFEVVRITPWQREQQPAAVGERIRAAFARHAAGVRR